MFYPFCRPALLLATALACISCTSTKTLSELETIQNEHGFYSQSICYTGSSRFYHYFDQWAFLGDYWWVPFHEDDSQRSYRIPRSSLPVPAAWEFPHRTYQGEEDPRCIRVRVHTQPGPRFERRSERRPLDLDPSHYDFVIDRDTLRLQHHAGPGGRKTVPAPVPSRPHGTTAQ